MLSLDELVVNENAFDLQKRNQGSNDEHCKDIGYKNFFKSFEFYENVSLNIIALTSWSK